MSRTEKWVALGLAGLGLIPAAIGALWLYVSATAETLHPSAAGVASVSRSTPSPLWAGAVEAGRCLARAALIEQNLPGLSVAVGLNGEVVWAEGFGWADLDTRVPVSPELTFRIGTASTALTSAGVGLLLQEQRLRLDDEIQTTVPEFPKKPWPITLRQVMAHVAGLASDGGDESPLFSQRCDRPVEGLRAFADRDLRFEPGTQYRYTRYGFILVSAAVEAAAGEPFLMFMQKRVFDPLGMNDTRPESATESMPSRATPYFPRFAADPRYGLHLMRDLDLSCYAGSMVFLSTPSDLVRFGMAITGGGLLRPDTVQRLQTSHRIASGEETGYGLGWDLETVPFGSGQTRSIGHDGDVLGGSVASLWTFPEHGVAVAVTSNISYADTATLATAIAEAFAAQRAATHR